jgi:hypothetical protein
MQNSAKGGPAVALKVLMAVGITVLLCGRANAQGGGNARPGSPFNCSRRQFTNIFGHKLKVRRFRFSSPRRLPRSCGGMRLQAGVFANEHGTKLARRAQPQQRPMMVAGCPLTLRRLVADSWCSTIRCQRCVQRKD